MTRAWLKVLTGGLLILLLLAGGGLSWLFGTSHGAGWLLKAVGRQAGIELQVARIDGRLLDRIVLTDLTLGIADVSLSTPRLALDWQPFALRNRVLDIERLEIGRLTITARNAEATVTTPPEQGDVTPATLDPTVIPAGLTARIAQLESAGLELDGSDEPLVIFSRLAGRFEVKNRVVHAGTFDYRSQWVDLAGTFDWDLVARHLLMDAEVHLPESLVDPQLFADIAVPTRFPGHLDLHGDWNDYRGPVRFGTPGQVWLAADATGSTAHIDFADLKGDYLSGQLADGHLDLDWGGEEFTLDGALSGTGIDPTPIFPDLEAAADLDVTGRLLVPYDEQATRSSLATVLHRVRLHGRSLNGRAEADWLGTDLTSLELDLGGEGFVVQGHGRPAERLDFNFQTDDLRHLDASLGGAVTAEGWLRWTNSHLTGEATGTGHALRWQKLEIARLQFVASHLASEAEISLDLAADQVAYDELNIAEARSLLHGRLDNHRIELTMTLPGGQVSAALHGAYRDASWNGVLDRLQGMHPRLGQWALRDAAPVTWQSNQLDLGPLSLRSQRGEQLDLRIEGLGTDHRSISQVAWQNLDLSRLNDHLEGLDAQGTANGEFSLTLAGTRLQQLAGRLESRARLSGDFGRLEIETLNSEFRWDDRGLQLQGTFATADGGSATLRLNSEGPADWSLPASGKTSFEFSGLPLITLSAWMPEGMQLDGTARAEGHAEWSEGQRLHRLQVELEAEGLFEYGYTDIRLRAITASVAWDLEGLRLQGTIDAGQDGRVRLQVDSPGPPEDGWPKTARLQADLDQVAIAVLNPWLPAEMVVLGSLQGRAEGQLLNGEQIDLAGDLTLSEGQVSWDTDYGQVSSRLDQVASHWTWRGDGMSGELGLLLGEYGELQGTWQLPLPARLPINFHDTAPLSLTLSGRLRETGVLAAFLPLAVDETRGMIETDLNVAGTWQEPEFRGALSLKGAGGYIPDLGIDLDDLRVRLDLKGDRLDISEFRVTSGQGYIEGGGSIQIDQWLPAGFRITLRGERFELFDFPEFRLYADPDLVITDDGQRLRLEGSVHLPEMHYEQPDFADAVTSSPDTVIISDQPKDEQPPPLEFGVDIDLSLGKKVAIRTLGVDARLEGEVKVYTAADGELLARGMINVLDGSYAAYGAKLKIKQGQLRYTGDPLNNPGLSVYAIREIGNVQAGVHVTGRAEAPVVSLYSRPSMPERDVLGYILMGRAIRQDEEGTDMLLMGAGALLPVYGQGLSGFGITSIDIQGLISGGGGLSLRRQLSENWEVESTLGIESGIDLYYRIEFD